MHRHPAFSLNHRPGYVVKLAQHNTCPAAAHVTNSVDAQKPHAKAYISKVRRCWHIKPKSGKQVLMLPGLTDCAIVAENPLRLCVFA
jgi:hypothetical protein